MYKLHILPIVEQDIESIWPVSRTAAACITVFLEQLANDQTLLAHLTEHKFGDNEDEQFTVSKWLEYWNQNIDVWRLKIVELEDKGLRYRIIYVYKLENHLQNYYVLAVVHRDFDYDPEHETSKRVIQACHDLGVVRRKT